MVELNIKVRFLTVENLKSCVNDNNVLVSCNCNWSISNLTLLWIPDVPIGMVTGYVTPKVTHVHRVCVTAWNWLTLLILGLKFQNGLWPSMGVVQGFRWQLWLKVMLSHLKRPYPGWLQVRGSEINRSAVGFQFILLVDYVWARPLLYTYW